MQKYKNKIDYYKNMDVGELNDFLNAEDKQTIIDYKIYKYEQKMKKQQGGGNKIEQNLTNHINKLEKILTPNEMQVYLDHKIAKYQHKENKLKGGNTNNKLERFEKKIRAKYPNATEKELNEIIDYKIMKYQHLLNE